MIKGHRQCYHSIERIPLPIRLSSRPVQAVVKANGPSKENGQISTPVAPKSPNDFSMKLGIYNYVGGMTTHANPCGAATTWVVSTNS